MRLGQIPHPREYTSRFIPSILSCEPSGGFRADEHSHEKYDGRERLEGEWDDVLYGSAEVEERTVVDPEGYADSCDDEELIHSC